MSELNSTDMIVIRKEADPDAFHAWAEFYDKNECFKAMRKVAKTVNIMAVFGPWPPTNPAEIMQFQNKWQMYQLNAARSTDPFTRERIKRKYTLPDRPFYAQPRQTPRGAA